MLHLGSRYVRKGRVRDMPVLIHELTHAWQMRQSLLPEVFLCNGIVV
jgi:hypothetical protein